MPDLITKKEVTDFTGKHSILFTEKLEEELKIKLTIQQKLLIQEWLTDYTTSILNFLEKLISR